MVHIDNPPDERTVPINTRRGYVEQFEFSRRRAHPIHRHPAGQVGCYRSDDVPAMEGRRDRRGKEILLIAHDGDLFERLILFDKADDTVVGKDDYLSGVFGGDDSPVCSDGRIDDDAVDRPGWEIGKDLSQYERPGQDVAGRDVVRNIDHRCGRGDVQYHAFHFSGVWARASEIGQKRYDALFGHGLKVSLLVVGVRLRIISSSMDTCEGKFASLRCAMVERQLRARGISDRRVLEVMGEIPRERFLTQPHQHEAYEDRPIPIGFGQTISQPYIVALMSQELDVRPEHRVLDVGAGSGYQTAILACLGREVFAVERITELADLAGLVLAELGFDNVTLKTGDGTLGWGEHAPFDRIICGAAGPDVPEAWIEQLADDGRIVMPVGGPEVQNLIAIEKHSGKIVRRDICGVRFVKLIGQYGWDNNRP